MMFVKEIDSNQFCVLIYHCFSMRKNTGKAKIWLDKRYPNSALSKATMERWFAELKYGRTDTDDAEHSGYPNSAVVPENIQKVHKIVFSNCKMKVHKIVDILKISNRSVFTVLHKKCCMKKVFPKWMLRLFTVDQKL
uniref:Histonelysine Nmethyltransferase SETMARlike [Hydra vulgaris] n=1 Tax=Lepeophtheirus salmonis TaxID=72036 RepID=A0A0K2T737_LEPSM